MVPFTCVFAGLLLNTSIKTKKSSLCLDLTHKKQRPVAGNGLKVSSKLSELLDHWCSVGSIILSALVAPPTALYILYLSTLFIVCNTYYLYDCISLFQCDDKCVKAYVHMGKAHLGLKSYEEVSPKYSSLDIAALDH